MNGYIGKIPSVFVYWFKDYDEFINEDLKNEDNCVIFIGEQSKTMLNKFIEINKVLTE